MISRSVTWGQRGEQGGESQAPGAAEEVLAASSGMKGKVFLPMGYPGSFSAPLPRTEGDYM